MRSLKVFNILLPTEKKFSLKKQNFSYLSVKFNSLTHFLNKMIIQKTETYITRLFIFKTNHLYILKLNRILTKVTNLIQKPYFVVEVNLIDLYLFMNINFVSFLILGWGREVSIAAVCCIQFTSYKVVLWV